MTARLENAFDINFDCYDPITSQIYTCHNSSPNVACAMCLDHIDVTCQMAAIFRCIACMEMYEFR